VCIICDAGKHCDILEHENLQLYVLLSLLQKKGKLKKKVQLQQKKVKVWSPCRGGGAD